MDLSTLDDWLEYCRRQDAVSRDRVLSGSAWVADRISPPPVSDSALARIPLERARACRLRAGDLDDNAAQRELHQQALRWLDHPHPESSPTLIERIGRERQQIELALSELDR